MSIRHAAVEGLFYPKNPQELKNLIQSFLSQVPSTIANDPIPKVIIAPHAGYIYSGPIAAFCYASLQHAQYISRVVLVGPSHRYPLRGLGLSSADFFETPLGKIPVDQDFIQRTLFHLNIPCSDEAHLEEHALEVQLPFLQCLLKNFSIVPFLVGQAEPHEVEKALEALWGGKETLIVVSSDLSHYHSYAKAKEMDQKTAKKILNREPDQLDDQDACGLIPIQGALLTALQKELHGTLLDLRNSGDTAGPKDQVVGYGAFHFTDTEKKS